MDLGFVTFVGAGYNGKVETLGVEREARWRQEIRAALHVSDSAPNLETTTHSVFSPTKGVRAERVSYGTQFDMRIPGILYLPDPLPEEKIPSLIVVNGHGGDKYAWYAMYSGVLYAKGGAAVLTYDPTGEGERNANRESETREHDHIEDPERMGPRLTGLMITDLMQAVSYLCDRPETDAERISTMGYSLGSFVVGMTGAIDERIHCCVLAGGGNFDGHGEYWDRSKPMCQGAAYRSLQGMGDRGAILYTLHARRGPTLIYNGLEDNVVNIPNHGRPFFEQLHERTVDLNGSETGVFDLGFLEGASHRPHFVTRPVALWLESHQGFPNWSDQAIRGMPETRIGSWAEKHSVETDRAYATEIREFGTTALRDDIPGVDRSLLNVFPEAEWEEQKHTLVHEKWREQIRAKISRG